MSRDETLVGEDFLMSHDALGRVRLASVETDEVLIELPGGLKLTPEQLEAIGHAVEKARRKAYEDGRTRGQEDKATEIRLALGIVPGSRF